MNMLTLNTAFLDVAISLTKNDELVANYYSVGNKQNEQLIFQTLGSLLDNAQMSLQQIDCYVVIKGPGSYTGLRIGMSVAKTLGQVYQKPVIGVTSLELLASMAAPLKKPFFVLLNCARSEIFYARFQFKSGKVFQQTEIQLTTLESLRQHLNGEPVVLKRLVTRNRLFDTLFEHLPRHTLQYPIADGYPLLKLGLEYYQKYDGNFPIVNPLYVKKDV